MTSPPPLFTYPHRRLDFPGPVDTLGRMAPVEIAQHHLVLGELGPPLVPRFLSRIGGWAGRNFDGEPATAFEDLPQDLGRPGPVVVVDAMTMRSDSLGGAGSAAKQELTTAASERKVSTDRIS